MLYFKLRLYTMRHLLAIILILLSANLCFAQNFDELGYMISDSVKLDDYPTFPGGKGKLRNYTHVNFVNSPLYRRVFYKNKTQGYIYVAYKIDSIGKVSSPKANFDRVVFDSKKIDTSRIDSIKKEVSVELEKLFCSMPQWLPGKKNGRNVSVEVVSPIVLMPW